MYVPTIGDIVLYLPSHDVDAEPAVVTRVWSDTCVNLHVLPTLAGAHVATSVPLDSAGERPGSWHPRPIAAVAVEPDLTVLDDALASWSTELVVPDDDAVTVRIPKGASAVLLLGDHSD